MILILMFIVIPNTLFHVFHIVTIFASKYWGERKPLKIRRATNCSTVYSILNDVFTGVQPVLAQITRLDMCKCIYRACVTEVNTILFVYVNNF